MSDLIPENQSVALLLSDLRQVIDEARRRVATTINFEQTMLYWRVGARIRQDVLKNERAEYGKRIVGTVSRQLADEYGKGFDRSNVFRMLRFAELFPDEQIVSTLSRQLSWSHFVELLPVKNELARQFYAEMCRLECWNVRTLHQKINGLLFERTAISRKHKDLIKQELDALRDSDRLTPDLVFRNPYFLDFLGLADTYSERDLEAAILREVERFLLELGGHFTFAARQKRIVIDGEDFHIDLLLFHRALQCLVALDLKIGGFQAAHKGQMEVYLRWLNKHERLPHEHAPLASYSAPKPGPNASCYWNWTPAASASLNTSRPCRHWPCWKPNLTTPSTWPAPVIRRRQRVMRYAKQTQPNTTQPQHRHGQTRAWAAE